MNLANPENVERVAIIGAGTIGASWAAHFLARGMHVRVWDPGPGSEAAAAGRSVEALASERDARLLDLLEMLGRDR